MRVLWRFLFKMRVLCGYIDLNTRICGSTRIYAGIVATLVMMMMRNMSPKVSVDEEAKKGQFGWFEVMGVQMPYILRSGTSYIPIKVREVVT